MILLTAVFRELAATGRMTALTLAPMNPESNLYTALLEALRAAGWRGVHTYFCFANWTHPIAGDDWNTYLAGRSSRVRNTVQRKTRKFLDNGRGVLTITRDGNHLESAIGDFTDIYGRSWKREEPYPNFMPGLLRLAADRGWLRLGLAHYEGIPVAAQAWLVVEGTAYIFKLAYRQDYRQLSPGTVLTAHMMRYVIETDRVKKIDYMSGDDTYKSDWMSIRRECRGIAAYNPRSLRGGALLIAHRLRSKLKRLAGSSGA
ncbi:MAG: GNAT family N-acetyltransferase [Halioglobus sp.]|nr:GNAT family N-acetyltransferase [Halioglobus sp.]